MSETLLSLGRNLFRAACSIVVLFVLWVFFHPTVKAHGGMTGQTAAPAIPLPASERKFIELVGDYATRYQAAPNDMAKGALRKARATSICALIPTMLSGQAGAWAGTIETLSSSSKGKGVLTIKLADGITVGTVNNDFSDDIAETKTLLDPTSPIMTAAAQMREGQQVHFGGTFPRNDTDCIEVSDMTQEGAMTEPEFLFSFDAIEPISP